MLLNRSIKTIFDRKGDRLREIKGKKRGNWRKTPGGKALKLKEKKEEK